LVTNSNAGIRVLEKFKIMENYFMNHAGMNVK